MDKEYSEYRSFKKGGVYLECDYIASSMEIEELNFRECRRRRMRTAFHRKRMCISLRR